MKRDPGNEPEMRWHFSIQSSPGHIVLQVQGVSSEAPPPPPPHDLSTASPPSSPPPTSTGTTYPVRLSAGEAGELTLNPKNYCKVRKYNKYTGL